MCLWKRTTRDFRLQTESLHIQLLALQLLASNRAFLANSRWTKVAAFDLSSWETQATSRRSCSVRRWSIGNTCKQKSSWIRAEKSSKSAVAFVYESVKFLALRKVEKKVSESFVTLA